MLASGSYRWPARSRRPYRLRWAWATWPSCDVAPYRVTVVATSDPAVAEAIIRDTSVLVVARQSGTSTVRIGLGGATVASFQVTVSDQDAGVHALRLEARSPVSAHATDPSSSATRALSGVQTAPRPAAVLPIDAAGFVTALSDTQRTALAAYLQAPSVDDLAALLHLLTPIQQTQFTQLVAGASSELARASGVATASQAATTHGPEAGTTIQVQAPADPAATAAGVHVSAPAGIRVTVVPTWVGPVLSLSYVLQNNTTHMFRADASQIAVTGAAGGVTVRQLDLGDPAAVSPGGVETGVIALTPGSGPEVGVQWRLRSDDGTVSAVGFVVPEDLPDRSRQGSASGWGGWSVAESPTSHI